MAFSDLKFEEADFVGEDVASLPDQVASQAAFLKARMDNVAKNMIALGRFNDLIDMLAGLLCGVRFQPTSVVSVAHATETLFDFDIQAIAYGSDYPTRTAAGEYTIQKDGVYKVTANTGFAFNATGVRQAIITVNDARIGIDIRQAVTSNSASTAIVAEAVANCVVGDVIKVVTLQTSGGSLNTMPVTSNANGQHLAIIKIA